MGQIQAFWFQDYSFLWLYCAEQPSENLQLQAQCADRLSNLRVHWREDNQCSLTVPENMQKLYFKDGASQEEIAFIPECIPELKVTGTDLTWNPSASDTPWKTLQIWTIVWDQNRFLLRRCEWVHYQSRSTRIRKSWFEHSGGPSPSFPLQQFFLMACTETHSSFTSALYLQEPEPSGEVRFEVLEENKLQLRLNFSDFAKEQRPKIYLNRQNNQVSIPLLENGSAFLKIEEPQNFEYFQVNCEPSVSITNSVWHQKVCQGYLKAMDGIAKYSYTYPPQSNLPQRPPQISADLHGGQNAGEFWQKCFGKPLALHERIATDSHAQTINKQVLSWPLPILMLFLEMFSKYNPQQITPFVLQFREDPQQILAFAHDPEMTCLAEKFRLDPYSFQDRQSLLLEILLKNCPSGDLSFPKPDQTYLSAKESEFWWNYLQTTGKHENFQLLLRLRCQGIQIDSMAVAKEFEDKRSNSSRLLVEMKHIFIPGRKMYNTVDQLIQRIKLENISSLACFEDFLADWEAFLACLVDYLEALPEQRPEPRLWQGHCQRLKNLQLEDFETRHTNIPDHRPFLELWFDAHLYTEYDAQKTQKAKQLDQILNALQSLLGQAGEEKSWTEIASIFQAFESQYQQLPWKEAFQQLELFALFNLEKLSLQKQFEGFLKALAPYTAYQSPDFKDVHQVCQILEEISAHCEGLINRNLNDKFQQKLETQLKSQINPAHQNFISEQIEDTFSLLQSLGVMLPFSEQLEHFWEQFIPVLNNSNQETLRRVLVVENNLKFQQALKSGLKDYLENQVFLSWPDQFLAQQVPEGLLPYLLSCINEHPENIEETFLYLRRVHDLAWETYACLYSRPLSLAWVIQQPTACTWFEWMGLTLAEAKDLHSAYLLLQTESLTSLLELPFSTTKLEGIERQFQNLQNHLNRLPCFQKSKQKNGSLFSEYLAQRLVRHWQNWAAQVPAKLYELRYTCDIEPAYSWLGQQDNEKPWVRLAIEKHLRTA